MKTWSIFLDNRPEKEAGRPATDDWMLAITAPEERLLKFDTWIKSQLAARLRWPVDEQRRVKLLGQCSVRLESLIIELWRRGWMLDGKELSTHIRTALDDIAAAQAAGRVKEFFPFFCGVVDRYVGLNAEKIQAEARRLRGTQSAGDLIKNALAPMLSAGPTITELVAQRRSEINQERETKLRAKLTRARKESGDDGQASLFG